jgi:hypothetical protein
MITDKYSSSVESRSVITVFGQKDHINLDALYQRGHVWNYKNKILFIDSLIKGIIPNNIIINKITEHDGINNICIDGKQRLTSIFEFMKNKYPVPINGTLAFYSNINDKFDRKKLSILDKKKDYRIMTSAERSCFGDTNLSFAVYKNLNYPDQSEIFERIQNGVSMDTGEKVTSIIKNEVIAEIFNKICNSSKNKFSKVFTEKELQREKHVEFMSNIMFMIHKKNDEIPTPIKHKAFMQKLDLITINKLHTKILELFDFFFNVRLYNHHYILPIKYKYLQIIIYWFYSKFYKKYNNNLTDKKCNILLNLLNFTAKEVEQIGGVFSKDKGNKLIIYINNKYKKLKYAENIEDVENAEDILHKPIKPIKPIKQIKPIKPINSNLQFKNSDSDDEDIDSDSDSDNESDTEYVSQSDSGSDSCDTI